MTHQPLTKAEREELQRLHESAADATWSKRKFADLPITDCQLAAAARNALPRLLADLDAAEAERDALRQIAEGCCNATDGGCSPGVSIEFLRDVPSEVEHIKRERDRLRKMPQSAFEAATFRELNAMEAQRDRAESELDAERRMRVEAEAAAKRAEEERDALKAKLDDPRRVLIHETEVVATKEEIAKLKKELADLSEADEELHACRALVNATSENLSVDLERMVDDLAEANEKAARSEKDAHSWCELYTNTKAKLAALVEAVSDRFDVSKTTSPSIRDAQERDILTAIAAARGGAQ